MHMFGGGRGSTTSSSTGQSSRAAWGGPSAAVASGAPRGRFQNGSDYAACGGPIGVRESSVGTAAVAGLGPQFPTLVGGDAAAARGDGANDAGSQAAAAPTSSDDGDASVVAWIDPLGFSKDANASQVRNHGVPSVLFDICGANTKRLHCSQQRRTFVLRHKLSQSHWQALAAKFGCTLEGLLELSTAPTTQTVCTCRTTTSASTPDTDCPTCAQQSPFEARAHAAADAVAELVYRHGVAPLKFRPLYWNAWVCSVTHRW